MSFRITLSPFTVLGEVGGKVALVVDKNNAIAVNDRADFSGIVEKLERLRDEVCRIHGWEGPWGIAIGPEGEAGDNGVSV